MTVTVSTRTAGSSSVVEECGERSRTDAILAAAGKLLGYQVNIMAWQRLGDNLHIITVGRGSKYLNVDAELTVVTSP